MTVWDRGTERTHLSPYVSSLSLSLSLLSWSHRRGVPIQRQILMYQYTWRNENSSECNRRTCQRRQTHRPGYHDIACQQVAMTESRRSINVIRNYLHGPHLSLQRVQINGLESKAFLQIRELQGVDNPQPTRRWHFVTLTALCYMERTSLPICLCPAKEAH
jgi:hypothetical protein